MSRIPLAYDDSPVCPYNNHINCCTWENQDLKEEVCPNCGWNPAEEMRRKRIIRERIEEGTYIPHLWVPAVYDRR